MVLAAWPTSADAAVPEKQGDFWVLGEEDTVQVVSYFGPEGAVSIPRTLGNRTVIGISERAFLNNSRLTSVSVPDTVQTIGAWAFAYCQHLTSVSLPASVNQIGREAFIGSTNLVEINVERDNMAYASADGVLFDQAQTRLVCFPAGKGGRYSIPVSVISIDSSAFYWCRALKEVWIPNEVSSIGPWAFAECRGLRSIKLPDHLGVLDYGTLYGCDQLATIFIPARVQTIGPQALASCSRLASIEVAPDNPSYSSVMGLLMDKDQSTLIQVPEGRVGPLLVPSSVLHISDSALDSCAGVTRVEVDPLNPSYSSQQGGLLSKAGTVFLRCPAGMSGDFRVPEGVQQVGFGAFSDCRFLERIWFPRSLETMGWTPFRGCTGLFALYFEGDAPRGLGKPPPPPNPPFLMDSPLATAFYRNGSTGWTQFYEGAPTAVWVDRPRFADWARASGLEALFPAASGEGDDADSDGVSNYAEWWADTNPTQAASYPSIELLPRPGALTDEDREPISADSHAWYFASSVNRYYGIQQTFDLTSGPWQLIKTRVGASNATQMRFVLDRPTTNAFYRLVVLP